MDIHHYSVHALTTMQHVCKGGERKTKGGESISETAKHIDFYLHLKVYYIGVGASRVEWSNTPTPQIYIINQLNFIIMEKKNLSQKAINKGIKQIVSLTGQISQVLKQFDGLYNTILKECEGLTVEAFMYELGVTREIAKNGTKKGYKLSAVKAAWASQMLINETMCIYKNVVAKFVDGENAYIVYPDKTTALGENPKPISKYKLVTVESDKWSVSTILKGLQQSQSIEKQIKKADESEVKIASFIHPVILKTAEKNGEKVTEAVELTEKQIKQIVYWLITQNV